MPRAKADPNAPQVSKADRFKIAATEKMGRALDSIAKVGLVANGRLHEWTPEQAKRMSSALHAEVDRAMRHFDTTTAPADAFSFDAPVTEPTPAS